MLPQRLDIGEFPHQRLDALADPVGRRKRDIAAAADFLAQPRNRPVEFFLGLGVVGHLLQQILIDQHLLVAGHPGGQLHIDAHTRALVVTRLDAP